MATRKGLHDRTISYNSYNRASFDSTMPPVSSKASTIAPPMSEVDAPPHYDKHIGLAGPAPQDAPARPAIAASAVAEPQSLAFAPQAEFVDAEARTSLPPRPASISPLNKKARDVRIALWVFLAMFMAISTVEIGFSAAIVEWLITQRYSRRTWPVFLADRSIAYVSAVPRDLQLTGLDLCLSAGCVGLVLVGFGGIGALVLRNKPNFSKSLFSKIWYHVWMIVLLTSWLFMLATIIFVWLENAKHGLSTIVQANLMPDNNNYIAYPDGNWDPRSWYYSLSKLQWTSAVDRLYVTEYYTYIQGYYFNMIVVVVFGAVVLGLAIWDGILGRRAARQFQLKQ